MTSPSDPNDDRPNRLPWPPILDLGVLAAAWLLGSVIPLDILPTDMVTRVGGWLVFAVGISIAVAGIGYFKRIGTPVNPTGRAAQLATGGVYAWTRNPMYLGTVIAFVGLALARNSAWLLILTAALPFALFKLAIAREEAYLTRRFGPAYAAYRAKVRRWL